MNAGFAKILIANRGEIACRVIRTARRMGIGTVAVYSEADRGALHVEQADEAVCIGGTTPAESYLRIDAIVDACRASGTEAVHPGYGFLSENRAFREALERAGIAFVGPPAGAIESMGDKITSKRIAEGAGVNIIPGHTGVVRDADEAVRIAREVGYPVMLKASAGGGGKGMRIARDDAECREGFERAGSEARTSFGDDRLFIERFIEEPRHIEIQVLADRHGNTVSLGERECSIQRRHQKIIEEAPSPFIDPATRRAMGEQAVALARAVDYESAGTVEFIVDRDRRFYFLEMNTRLQVEHPVTEMVTGLDLVECMIRIAAGQPLGFGPEDVALAGWAMESRVYAENPLRGFLPSTGRLVRYLPPSAGDHVRVDTGVREGGEISMYYDPMIAKLITRGDTRDEAIHRMRDALDAYCIDGVDSNLAFLSAVFSHPRFVAGRLSTDFIEDEYPHGFGPDDVQLDHRSPHLALFVAVAAAIQCRYRERAARIAGRMPGGETVVSDDWVVVMNGREHPCRATGVEGGEAVEFDGVTHVVCSDWWFGQPRFRGTVNGEPKCFRIEPHGVGYRLFHRGMQAEAYVLTPRQAELWALMPERAAPDLSRFLLSPMPGLLVSLAVREGDRVKAGQDLAVIEAMKMENVLRAENDATVKAVHVAPGDSLAVDQPILEFE
ncbi:MAG: acetyl/propionyl/methylcrotonyl-CoA carboxylase subunit alpha [Thiotrichales bacterium]|nr:acetyl/propionyl/methylcrotonyl-CoA carboxylase subunit alpha [Thiotrichales bacterium]